MDKIRPLDKTRSGDIVTREVLSSIFKKNQLVSLAKMELVGRGPEMQGTLGELVRGRRSLRVMARAAATDHMVCSVSITFPFVFTLPPSHDLASSS